MFCSNCGKEISNGAKFCSYCGAEVKADKDERNLSKDYLRNANGESKADKASKDAEDEYAVAGVIDIPPEGINVGEESGGGLHRLANWLRKMIRVVAGLAVTGLAILIIVTVFRNHQEDAKFKKWVYDEVVESVNNSANREFSFTSYKKSYVTEGEMAQVCDFGKGKLRYVPYEVELHFDEDKEQEIIQGLGSDHLTVKAYYYDNEYTEDGWVDTSIDSYLYVEDNMTSIMRAMGGKTNGSTGSNNSSGNNASEATPTPAPTEEVHDDAYYENLCIPEGTWLSQEEINPIVLEVLGIEYSDDVEKMNTIYKWVCKEVTMHYVESLPEECQEAKSFYFYPRAFIDTTDDDGTVLAKNDICVIDVYVPRDVKTYDEAILNGNTVNQYFEIQIAYSKSNDQLIVDCPGKDLGQEECDINQQIYEEWEANHGEN